MKFFIILTSVFLTLSSNLAIASINLCTTLDDVINPLRTGDTNWEYLEGKKLPDSVANSIADARDNPSSQLTHFQQRGEAAVRKTLISWSEGYENAMKRRKSSDEATLQRIRKRANKIVTYGYIFLGSSLISLTSAIAADQYWMLWITAATAVTALKKGSDISKIIEEFDKVSKKLQPSYSKDFPHDNKARKLHAEAMGSPHEHPLVIEFTGETRDGNSELKHIVILTWEGSEPILTVLRDEKF